MDNEIAEALIESSIETAFPLELPEMDDIVDAQEALLIHIPADFRDYLLECSHVIYGSLEPVTVADPNSHTFLPEVAAEAWERGMPRQYIPLCQSGENYYCVEEDGTVYLWEPGHESPEEAAENIWFWVRDVWLES